MNKLQALNRYWNRFGPLLKISLPAYNELSVPPTQKNTYPYLTYEVGIGSLDGMMTLSGSLWHRGTSWEAIAKIFEDMEPLLDAEIPYDGGVLKIRTPNAMKGQTMDDPSDDLIKRIVITIEAEFLSA